MVNENNNINNDDARQHLVSSLASPRHGVQQRHGHYYMVRINHRDVGRVSLSLSFPPQAVVKITNLCYQWMSQ
jgi:hypothetical protein